MLQKEWKRINGVAANEESHELTLTVTSFSCGGPITPPKSSY